MNLKSYISFENEWNIIDIEFKPTNTIQTNYDKLVIELPTVSLDGITLFSEDAGTGLLNYD